MAASLVVARNKHAEAFQLDAERLSRGLRNVGAGDPDAVPGRFGF